MQAYGRVATYQLVPLGEAIAPVFKFVPRFIEWLAPGFVPPWLLDELDRRNLGFDRVLFATDCLTSEPSGQIK